MLLTKKGEMLQINYQSQTVITKEFVEMGDRQIKQVKKENARQALANIEQPKNQSLRTMEIGQIYGIDDDNKLTEETTKFTGELVEIELVQDLNEGRFEIRYALNIDGNRIIVEEILAA